jgi:tetratricopeptide (TPR) repeat protein
MERSIAREEDKNRHGMPRCLIAVGLFAGLWIWLAAAGATARCDGEGGRDVQACMRRYVATAEPQYLSWAAQGELQRGALAAAAVLAQQLLAGRFAGDAHRTLGYVAMRGSAYAAARRHGALALAAHLGAGDRRAQARDLVLLAQVAQQDGDWAGALAIAAVASQVAPATGAPDAQRAAHFARAEALLASGDPDGAAAALAKARELATTPCDLAWVHFKRGLVEMRRGGGPLAIARMADASDASWRCGNRDLATSIALNLVSIMRMRGQPALALALLEVVSWTERETYEILALRGKIAGDLGDLDVAERWLKRAQRLAAPDADWPWQLEQALAEVAELRASSAGDKIAELHYRRAVSLVAELRATPSARLRFVVASHRGPYTRWIALMARQGRWRDALEGVLELDASDMLRATAAEASARSGLAVSGALADRGAVARVDDVVAAWRSRELVIVVAAAPPLLGPSRERSYRLRVADGEVTGEDVGPASTALAWARELFQRPDADAPARGLGALIVPPDPTHAVLHVLAVGALGKLPLAALRDGDGALVIARRPIVRVLGLRATGAEARGRGPGVVIADPTHTLPGAAAEGPVAAAAIGAGARGSGSWTATPGTCARLWEIRDAAVAHLATHVAMREVVTRERVRVLQLADCEVAPEDIERHELAPRIAVLAGCGSAAATDDEGWGSIAAAMLEAGTAVVIATDRSIKDGESLSVMRGFYAQADWQSDPARALARVQSALAGHGDAALWAAFSVMVRPPEMP